MSEDVEVLASADPQTTPELWRARAELALASGDEPAARRAIEIGLSQPCPLHIGLPLHEMAVRIEAPAANAGDPRAADRVRAHLAEIERRLPPPDALGGRIHRPVAIHAQALAHVAPPDEEIERWRTAVARWDDAGFIWHAAEARCRLAESLLRHGARNEARETLARATETAESIGARPIIERARTLSHHAGLDAPSDDGSDDASAILTQRELDVLRLVGEGQTNRQIGEALFISPKTVSVHVSRMFQKLEVQNRTEAAAAGRRAGLIP